MLTAAQLWTKVMLGLMVLSLFGVGLATRGTVQAAAPNAVIINEIMYNPGTGNQNDEFLELYNTTSDQIDLEGWTFTAGISLTFQAGVTIGAYDYIIVSPDIPQSLTTYGVVSTAAYAPSNLSNGGETVTLQDNLGNTIDQVAYDDSAPWPSSPDGGGYSLELKADNLDNTLSESWGASLATAGTPLLENSLVGLSLPDITGVTDPDGIVASQAVGISALVEGAGITAVELKYRVGFNAEQTLTMVDDGSHGDGAAGDDVYGAELPGQVGGTLVRFRVEAENASGIAAVPSNDESIDYAGYVVDDGTVSEIPILRWFIADADFTNLTTNHLSDDVFVPAVVAIGDQVFDNSQVRVKGGSSVQFAKRKYKFELPAGYVIDQPGFGNHIDEFSIQVYFLNLSEFPERLTSMALERYGFPPLVQKYVRVHKNGVGPSDFYGHFLFAETYDSTWRQANDYESGALYKEVLDKKTRTNENSDDIDGLMDAVQSLTGEELKDYLYDNLDIANIINYNAIMAVIRNDDWFLQHNQFQYRNTETTGRWEYLPWDNDNSFMPIYFTGPFAYTRDPIIDPLPSNQSGPFYQYRLIERAMFQFDEFEDMYYRRVATIFDDLYASNRTKEWFQQLFNASEDTMIEDFALWGQQKQDLMDSIFGVGTIDYPAELLAELTVTDADNFFAEATPEDIHKVFDYGEDKFKVEMLELRSQNILPQSQASAPDVIISNVVGSGSASYIEIQNQSDSAVDLSGWNIPSLGFTFAEGTVLAASQSSVVVRDDVTFRQQIGTGYHVLGQASSDISSDQSYELTNTIGAVIDRLDPVVADTGQSNQSVPKKNTIRRSSFITPDTDPLTTDQADGSSPTCILNSCTTADTADQNNLAALQGGKINPNSALVLIGLILGFLIISRVIYTRYKHK